MSTHEPASAVATDETIAGLREHHQRFFDEAADRLESLQSDNERLRKALDLITKVPCYPLKPRLQVVKMVELADTALASAEQRKGKA